MIEVECFICANPIEEKAALLLSPPDANDMVKKDHICVTCYPLVLDTFKNDSKRGT